MAANGAARRRSRSALAVSVPEGFDEFWRAYPRKKGKGAALKAWRGLQPDHDLTTTILNALSEQRQWPEWRRDAGKFVPYPATWLNQARWCDERDPAPVAFTGPTAGNLAAMEEWQRKRQAYHEEQLAKHRPRGET